MLDERRRSHEQEGDFIEFVLAGTAVNGEFRCSGCGYGVTLQAALPHCPMCAGSTWEASDSGAPRERRNDR